jgi:hypothetical protein
MPQRTSQIAACLSAGTVCLALAGCSPPPETPPEIKSIQWPSDILTDNETATIMSTLTVDRGDWKYVHALLTVAEEVDGVADFEETQVTDASCVPSAGGTLDCVAALELALGTWRYQWHVEYGQSERSTEVISTPDPPKQAFTVARATPEKPSL